VGVSGERVGGRAVHVLRGFWRQDDNFANDKVPRGGRMKASETRKDTCRAASFSSVRGCCGQNLIVQSDRWVAARSVGCWSRDAGRERGTSANLDLELPAWGVPAAWLFTANVKQRYASAACGCVRESGRVRQGRALTIAVKGIDLVVEVVVVERCLGGPMALNQRSGRHSVLL
jgi:hypothetical protein